MPSRDRLFLGCAILVAGLACARPQGPRDERLRADVRWLAHPERGGRRAGTQGETAAAEFLAARLAGLGLEPGGEEGYFQRFPLQLPPRDGGASYLVLRESSPEGGEIARRIERGVPLSFSGAGRAQGPVAFRGYGVQAEELGWLDHGQADAPPLPLNAVVLLVDGLPPALSGIPERSLPNLLERALEARRRGAIALLVAEHPSSPAPARRFESALAADIGLPVLWIDAGTARLLLPDYDRRVEELDRERRHDRPAPEAPTKVDVFADLHRESGTGANVLALLRGGGGPAVVVSASYDHLGLGGPGSLDPEAGEGLRPGADHNASGVAVALEVARALAHLSEPPAGDVLFALLSGSELGELGSDAWFAAPSLPLSRVALCIDLGPVGRAGRGRLSVLGAGSSPAFAEWLPALAARSSLLLEPSFSTRGLGGGARSRCLAQGIPVLHLTSGPAPEHHRIDDAPERFEAQGAAKVASLVLALIQRAQAEAELPFRLPASPPEVGEQGYPVRFGAVRALDHLGSGLALASVSPGSPAERAGLARGDVLLEAGGILIDAMQDFLHFLQIHRPADVVRVRFRRDGRSLESLLTLEGRAASFDLAGGEPPRPPLELRSELVPQQVIDRDLEIIP